MTGPQIREITACIEQIAPLDLQEDYDNAGLLTGDGNTICTGVLCTLDITEEVIAEAVSRSCNLIVAHHPIIFRAVRQLRPSGYVRRSLIGAIKNDLALYAAHTNLDNVADGVNGEIARRLGLVDTRVLAPKSETTGSGLIGLLPSALPSNSFLELLADRFNTGIIRHNTGPARDVSKVAVCGGAGSFLITNALEAGADAFVTADLKYHEFFEAEKQLLVCDVGHYESEQFTTDLFVDIIRRKFPNFAVLKSGVITNPVHYFSGK